MSISKIDLLNKKFSKSMFGYDKAEVEELLLEIAETVGALSEDKKNLARKVQRLETAVEEYRKREETLRDTLMSTQRMVEDIRLNAEREASNVVDEAQLKAEGMVQQAHNRVAEVYEEINLLKRQRVQFELELRGVIETHLGMLDAARPERDRLDELESKLKFLKAE